MYMLVSIAILAGSPLIEAWSTYDSLEQCFDQREALLVNAKHYDGYFPANTQVICIRMAN